MNDYKSARISRGKEWFVEYSIEDPTAPTGWKRYKTTGNGEPCGSLNRIKNLRERERSARMLRDDLNDLLAGGWRPGQELSPDLKNQFKIPVTIAEAFDNAEHAVKRKLGDKTFKTYQGTISKFLQFLENSYPDLSEIKDLKAKQIQAYLDKLLKEGLSNHSYNNHCSTISSYFREMIRNDIVAANPCDKIDCLKVQKEGYALFSEEQLGQIAEYCLARNDLMFFLYLSLVHGCMLRPGTLRDLRIKHIDLSRKGIRAPAEITKNNDGNYTWFSEDILELLLAHGVKQAQPNDYLFTIEKKPGPVQIGQRYFIKRFNKMRKHFKWPPHIKIYGLKHTGGIELYEKTLDPIFVKDQMRLKSLNTLYIYLQRYRNRKKYEDQFNSLGGWKSNLKVS